MLTSIKRFFRPKLVIETAHTAYGPAIDVKRSLLGFRFRVGDDTFARVASAYIDGIPGWRPDPHRLRLAGGATKPHAVPRPAPRLALQPASRRAAPRLPRAQALSTLPRIAPPPISAAWARRCDTMAADREWGSTPEVQAAAYLYGSRIRVFTPDANGSHTVRFIANPGETAKTLDLVLEDFHYNWIGGGVSGDTISAEEATRLRTVTGDGNCLFRCLSEGLAGGPSDHATARRDVVDYLRGRERMPLDGSGGLVNLADL